MELADERQPGDGIPAPGWRQTNCPGEALETSSAQRPFVGVEGTSKSPSPPIVAPHLIEAPKAAQVYFSYIT